MKPATDLPDDPALPGVGAIRALGLARAIPALGLDGRGVELVLRGYTPGSRATIEVREEQRHFVVKAYTADPAAEAGLYQALAAGLGGDSGTRVPPLLAWDHDFRVLVIGWLDGATTHELLKTGQGERAGELAARWFERAFSLPVPLGQALGAGHVLCEAGRSVTELVAVDPTLRAAASAVGEALADSQPSDGVPRLVHGALYDRHVLDQDDAVGVIDWRHFGQGPLELDAAMFLATVTRTGLLDAAAARAAARAQAVFLAGTRPFLDGDALIWYRVAALLRLARRQLKRRKDDWRARAQVLLGEAARLAGAL